MKNVHKQIIGIDISKDTFYTCYMVLCADERSLIKGTKSFPNISSGYQTFHLWCSKCNKTPEICPIYIMEATGVYYEDLAYYLHEQGAQVSIQLANKLNYFAKSCGLKTKTDKVDAKMIASFEIEKSFWDLTLWNPPSKEFKVIRDLAREHSRLKAAQTTAKVQLHALNHAHEIYEEVIEMKKEQISFYAPQIETIETSLRNLVNKSASLQERIANIETVKGLGFMTIIKVVAETNGFLLFKNIGQLVSYARLDVVEKQSGKFKNLNFR